MTELSYSDFWPQTRWCRHWRVFKTNYLYQVLRFSGTYLTLDWARITVSSSQARVHFTLVLGYELFSLLKTLMNLKQTIIYKLLRRKRKIEKHDPHNKPEANSGAPGGNSSQVLQEKWCTVEQDFFGVPWGSIQPLVTFINALFPVQQNVHITYTKQWQI